jgi:hypothetical protein
MTAAAFRYNGVDFLPLESQGAYFGVDHSDTGKAYLVCVGMLVDGTPDTHEGEPNVVEVSNFDERWDLLDEVNALLGTAFTPSMFPGR